MISEASGVNRMIDWMTPWTVVLHGRPISKKNSREIRVYGGVTRLVASDAHQTWLGLALVQIIPRRPPVPFGVPVAVDVDIACKGRIDLDVDNALSSVLDLLVTANVLEDDCLVTDASVGKTGGHDDWRVAITVTPVSEMGALR